jgi:CBS domain-containing protein
MVEERTAGADTQELEAVAEFLRGSLPFNELDDAALGQAVAALKASYHPHGTRFDAASEPTGLRILRSGAVDIRDRDNKLLDRLGEGESFHIGGLNVERGEVVATVIEDALVYRLPDEDYQALRRAHRAFDRYFSGQRSRRLRRAARYQPEPNLMLAPVSSVMTRDLLTVPPEVSVHQVAVAMAHRRVSSAFVVEDEVLIGIVTDRDLRTRVVAEKRPPDTPLRDVMTANPETIDAGDSLFETTLLMTRRGFHHLPVLEAGRLAGIVTTSDLILARKDDPVYLVQHISRQADVDGIRELLTGMPNLMVHWVNGGMRARQVSQILTAISDAVAVRLIQLAEEALGPAPGPGHGWALAPRRARSSSSARTRTTVLSSLIRCRKRSSAGMRRSRRACATDSPPVATTTAPGASWLPRIAGDSLSVAGRTRCGAGRARRPPTRSCASVSSSISAAFTGTASWRRRCRR